MKQGVECTLILQRKLVKGVPCKFRVVYNYAKVNFQLLVFLSYFLYFHFVYSNLIRLPNATFIQK